MPGAEILKAIERYCNNYFNPDNDPASPVREYPEDFLALAGEIEKYSEGDKGSTSARKLKGESFAGYSYTAATSEDGQLLTWHKAYAPELAAFKRVKFI